MRFGLSLLIAVGVSGCFLSHGRDGDVPRRDTGVRRDSARDTGFRRDTRFRGDTTFRPDTRPVDGDVREGDYWELVEREAFLSIPHALGCDQAFDGRVAVRVAVPLNTVCEVGGPVSLELAPDGTHIVRAFIWAHRRRDPDACLGVTDISERTVLIQPDTPMFFATASLGGSTVEYGLSLIDGPPCHGTGARGSSCLRDCECADSMQCIPELGDFVMCLGGRCGRACDIQESLDERVYGRHLDCDPSEQCVRGELAAHSCEPISGGSASCETRPCGEGLWCSPGEIAECRWMIELGSANRHPCADDRDCDPALRCVQHADGERACEVPCFTSGMRCPRMHECRAPRFVCEWIGE